ncbi:hypothetical protein QBZ16_002015 [Prototheca wickerhamii]|uniref:Uncharacterized protein n=1 Tax=Prototheca wickerhamii TaxID=3111 RepID=A0AAD9MLE9_PROWI|nr:hypothetical protein QBZ16_002015 [Prototheca wickerhamii]
MEGGMSKDDFLALLDTLVPAWSNMDNPMASDKSSTAESLAALTESGSMGHGVGNGPTYYSPRASGTPHGGTDAMSLDAREEIRLKNRECLLDEIEAAHREHKFLASDILIKEKLLRTRNDALEVLQLGRQVAVTLPEVFREGNLTYGQAILLEAAAMRINLSGCPELKNRELEEFLSAPMDSLYATARGIHEELEHVLDARDRLEALSSHDFVERVEMQVMGLLAKQSMFLWKVGRHRPGIVADVYASGKQLLPNGPDAKAIAKKIRLGPKRAARFVDLVMARRARIVETLLESRKSMTLGTGMQAAVAALGVRCG